MRVLVADDDAICRNLLAKLLGHWGYDVSLAADGEQALATIMGEEPPNMAIIDWSMPKYDGLEICRRIKRSTHLPFIYTIMLTGRDTREDMITGLEAGADDFLGKPVDTKVLRSRLAAGARLVQAVPPQQWSLPRIPGYEVQKLLGRGSIGSVWQAVEQATGRAVALKIIRRDIVTAEDINRFAIEIMITRSLNHPNIARVYDSRLDDAYCYYAMELIDGHQLNRYVKDEDPSMEQLLALMAQVCQGVGYAHQCGVVHRDLKPQNIMVTSQGVPKVVDFGVAKSIPQGAKAIEEWTHTTAGHALGTPMYMAPEQAQGHNQSLDARTDVYSLGVILYILLVRHHPCKLDHTSQWTMLQSVGVGDVRPPHVFRPDFDPALERILMKALARDPAMRYRTAAEFGEALTRYITRNVAAA